MTIKKVELLDGGRGIKYIFDIPLYKYTVLQGESATGKTTFYDTVVRYYEQSSRNVSFNIDFSGEDTIELAPFVAFYRDPSNFYKSIIVIDEDDLYCSDITKNENNIFYTMKHSNNYFILITREFGIENIIKGIVDDVQSMPVRLLDMYNINTSIDNDGYIINMFCPIYKDYYYNNYQYPVKIDNVIIEDKQSGFLFFEHYYNLERNKNLFTSNGKKSLLKVLSNKVENGYDNILVVYDSCSYGLLFRALLIYLKRNKHTNIYLLDWESFEYHLLTSPNILEHNDINSINNKILDYQFTDNNGVYTIEASYEKILKEIMSYYKKEFLCRCLLLGKDYTCSECYKKTYNNKCNISTSEKEVNYTHSPLDKFIINGISYRHNAKANQHNIHDAISNLKALKFNKF